MKRVVIGYIFNDKKFTLEDRKFQKIAKKLNIELVLFNLANEIDEDDLEERAKKCDIIFNDSGEYISLEIAKTFEVLGKKVVEDPKVAYYPEDKWVFYVECKKNSILTPRTILLSTNIHSAKQELLHFNSWPVVLKRVSGCRGEFVERARDLSSALKIVQAFWDKGNERLPVLAQEYISSDSYRVTLIDGKIVQTARKKRSGWKASGCYANRFTKFKVDPDLERASKKIAKMSKIKICGIDFAKHKGKWYVIEVNAEPSLKLFDCDHDLMIEETLKFLKRSI